ncbi:hypothetical protein MT418_000452 [Batrachochytrium dendrobatidis]
MKFTHISAFTIVALTTSVHAILPQPSETIESADPSPSLNSQSIPQATGGPEFPSTSTTQGSSGSQGDRSDQTLRPCRKPSKFGTLLGTIGKGHGPGHRKSKRKSKCKYDGSIDSFLELFPELLELLYLGNQNRNGESIYFTEDESNHHRIAKAIVKGISVEKSLKETNLRRYTSLLWSLIGTYESWFTSLLKYIAEFKAIDDLAFKFIEEFEKIIKGLVKVIGKTRKGIYRTIQRLNKNSSLVEKMIETIISLAEQFVGYQNRIQELFKELFRRYSRIDWYNINLEPKLNLWLQRFGATVEGYNIQDPSDARIE